MGNDTAKVKAILKANPDLDVGSEDHFFFAMVFNCLEIFKLLLDHPATDLNKRNKLGKLCLRKRVRGTTILRF